MAGKKIILDSCIVIELQKGNKKIIEEVYKFDQENIFITPIVIAEFYRGARDKKELTVCKKLIAKFRVLALDERVVDGFSKLFENYALSHRPSIPDVLIAATSVYYQIPLFTLNKKDFQFIPSIELHEY